VLLGQLCDHLSLKKIDTHAFPVDSPSRAVSNWSDLLFFQELDQLYLCMDWMDFDLIAGWLNPAVRQHITDELKIEV